MLECQYGHNIHNLIHSNHIFVFDGQSLVTHNKPQNHRLSVNFDIHYFYDSRRIVRSPPPVQSVFFSCAENENPPDRNI